MKFAWKTMYNNKQVIDDTSPSIEGSETEAETQTKDIAKRNWNIVEQLDVSDIRDHSVITTTSCTSSTDSGVNVSDNDEVLPASPTTSDFHTFPTSAIPASEPIQTAVVATCHRKLHKTNNNNQQYNNKQINKDNNCPIINNNNNNSNYNNNNCIFKGGYKVDHDDDNDDSSSETFDYESKVLVDCGSVGGRDARCTPKQNIIECRNVRNASQQEISTTLMSSDKEALQHNVLAKPHQRVTASPSSSLSMSSISVDYCSDNPASRNHPCSGSPVVSIRSISSAIITSDSDAEFGSDAEDYVIKKLGTQVSYSPKDPNIPNITSGHTVLNQKVVANDSQAALASLATLAAIGDRIGAAQALGVAPATAALPQRPQIGSIALNNSSDVTFGDKHFYEGPVTIQQFLIEGRDKWKDTNGEDKAASTDENAGTFTCTTKDINSAPEKSSKLYEYVWKRKKLAIPGILACLTLLIVAAVLASISLNDSKNSSSSHDHDDDHECDGNNGTFCLIGRDIWRAHPSKNPLDKQKLPLHRVVISHTASEPCESITICSESVRIIQEFHMNSLGWDDIAYNFLVSSDGRVYMGRGWDFVGAHTKGYNYDSVGISFIGTYTTVEPTEVQLEACLSLLEEGLRLGKLTADYRLYGEDNVGGGYVLRIVPRGGWLAQPPVNPWVPLQHPVHRVIVIPTRTSECETQAACTYTVRITQTYNIESQQQDDIIYNFLIGGDGNVYEGRGWNNRGSVIKGFNDDSISLAFIGSFKKQPPSYKQLNVTDLLLQEGVRLKKLSAHYKIVGANKLDPTSVATAADALYKSFENWPHWSDV